MTRVGRLRQLRWTAALLALAIARPAAAAPVEITFTAHGVPHIRAQDFRGAGYGYGYAAAKIDLCSLATTFVDAGGRRAEDFGAEQMSSSPLSGRPVPNVSADLVNHLLIDKAMLADQRAGLTPDARALVEGYAQGFNRYLADTPVAARPKACRDAAWVRPIRSDDVLRRVASAVLMTGLFDTEMMNAEPPSADAEAVEPAPALETVRNVQPSDAGSNGYAFGGDLTRDGRGLLVGNPHWFWGAANRLMEAHLTVPGRYDVMGASVLGMPLITIGFNRTLAWTHTVATDLRGTVFELALDPQDPTRYLVDGRSIPMRSRVVIALARGADGEVRMVSHTFWLTEFGPVVASPQLPWNRTHAYALADANRSNNRYLNQLLEIGSAPDVRTLKQRLAKTQGLVWLNTLAADAKGDALYADYSVVPDVPADLFAACSVKISFPQATLANVMDGSKSACRWRRDAGAAAAGVMPAAAKPSLVTRDYVENSNSSHWLVNRDHLLEGYSPLIGKERTPPNLRTRYGHLQVGRFAAGARDGSDPRNDQSRIEEILFSNEDMLAELVLDDLLKACRASPQVTAVDGRPQDLTEACRILSAWDRRHDLDSRGAHLFREFAREVRAPGEEDPATLPGFWSTPFDPAHPLTTPAGLNTATDAPLRALGRAVKRLEAAHVPLDARLGDIQFIERNGRRLPLHGGLVFNRISLTLTPGVGYTEPMASADSYIQVVGFSDAGPVADTLLVDSQSSDPASPWHADQAELYRTKRWVRAPYSAADVAKEAIAPIIRLHPAAERQR
jgi:acyl-homoserine-lactone acylase